MSSHAEMAMDKDGKVSGAARAHRRQHGCLPVDVCTCDSDDFVRDACSPANTPRRKFTSRSMPGSPTPRRSMPIAVRGALKRPTCWSAWCRAPAGNWVLSQDEIRRRNLIVKDFPYQTPVALAVRRRRLSMRCSRSANELADVAGLSPSARPHPKARGLLRGMGYSSYIEACGLAPSNVAGALGAHVPACSSAAKCAFTRRAA